jgi:hypothetical protein
MKQTILAGLITATLIAAPLWAETPVVPDPNGDEGFSLMEEGAKLFMRGVMSQMEPALDDMGRALDQVEPSLRALGPKLQELIAMVDDLRNYHAPEKLDNGDIIMRRKTPQEILLDRIDKGVEL